MTDNPQPDKPLPRRRHPRWQWTLIVAVVLVALTATAWKLRPLIELILDPAHGDPARDILLSSECGWTIRESSGGPVRSRIDLDYMPECLMKTKRGWWDGDCTRQYETLLGKISTTTTPIDPATIDAMAADPERFFGPEWSLDSDDHALSERLLALLEIEPLWRELRRTPVDVHILAVVQDDDRCGQTLIFDHPLTGPFRVELRVPRRKARYGAMVAVHGHGDTPDKLLKTRFNSGFYRDGVVIAAPSVRTFGSGVDELAVSERFVLAGSGLLVPHVFEQWLVVEFLRGLDYVDPARLGIFGHSGGSDIAFMTAALRTDVRAVSIDHVGESLPHFREQRPSIPVYFQADSLPRLWAFRGIPRRICESAGRVVEIRPSASTTAAVICFPYDYANNEKPLELFWEARLGG